MERRQGLAQLAYVVNWYHVRLWSGHLSE